jgi:hypothetical protein
LFVAGETFAIYFVRERKGFELRNTHTHTHPHTHSPPHTMVKIAGEKNWYSILSVPMLVDDHALKKGIERCFFRATQIRTSQLMLMMLSIWSRRLIKCYMTKKSTI